MGYGLLPLRVQVVQGYNCYPSNLRNLSSRKSDVTATKHGLIEHGVLSQNKQIYSIQAEQLIDSKFGMLLPHQDLMINNNSFWDPKSKRIPFNKKLETFHLLSSKEHGIHAS